MIFYYSGCGNSRFIAQSLADSLGEKMVFIPDLQRQGFSEYEAGEGESVGFVFPVYAWGAPKLVEDFVLSVHWKVNSAYVWFACTAGDEMGYTHRDFKKTLAQAGLALKGTFFFQMPETYLCMPGFHLDTPENAEKKISAARAKLPWAAEQIASRAEVVDQLVGPMPGLKSTVIRPGFNRYMSDKGYRVTDACTGCGICEKKCPLKNISLENGHPVWHGNCTQCMACYHYCPQNAIHYGSCTKGKGQYHF